MGAGARAWGAPLAAGSACACGESGDQVPTGSALMGCASSGSDARLARKWRIRHASAPLMVAMCSSVHASPPAQRVPQSSLGFGLCCRCHHR